VLLVVVVGFVVFGGRGGGNSLFIFSFKLGIGIIVKILFFIYSS